MYQLYQITERSFAFFSYGILGRYVFNLIKSILFLSLIFLAFCVIFENFFAKLKVTKIFFYVFFLEALKLWVVTFKFVIYFELHFVYGVK